MSIIERMLKQTAVYWPPAGEESSGEDFDGYGRPISTAAYEILCRWEEKSEQFLDSDNNIQISNAIVYVGEDVRKGGYLFLGELTDLEDVDNPQDNDNAWEIMKFEKNPNLKATKFLRTAYL